METIESARQFWAGIAKQHGWYCEPFYVQVWVDSEGKVVDSVSTIGMSEDIIDRI